MNSMPELYYTALQNLKMNKLEYKKCIANTIGECGHGMEQNTNTNMNADK